MRYPNRFINPADGAVYAWPLNHAPDGAEDAGLERQIDHSATTSGTGVVRQQGAETPMRLVRRGQILEAAQHTAMKEWAELGQAQTIYYEEADPAGSGGDRFEVLVVSFRSRRVGVLNNPRADQATAARLFKWEFTLEMEVVNVLMGDWL